MTTNIVMNAIGSKFTFQSTDGKNLGPAIDGMEWVRISEKKIGKGKGKTVAAISVPSISTDHALFTDALNSERKEMLTNLYRNGVKEVSEDECGFDAVIRFYAGKVFSEDAIGEWFDSEMGEYLGMNICTARGWDDSGLSEDQRKILDTKLAAYKAAFLECGAKFPKLAPEQRKELIRVIRLNELSGGIVDRIMEKLEPKTVSVEESLGF